MKTSIKAIFAAVALASSMAAMADATPSHYVGVNLGGARAHDISGSFNRDFGAGAVTNTDRNDWTGGATVGVRLTDIFAVEAGYQRLGDFDGKVAGVKAEYQDVEALTLVGVANYNIGNGFGVHGKLGVSHTDLEARFAGAKAGESSDLDLTYGLGGSYAIDKAWSVTADWNRFQNVADTHVDVDTFTAGIRFNF